MKVRLFSHPLLATFLLFGSVPFAFSDELPPGLAMKAGGDELPHGLMQAISNPAIPTIVDATILVQRAGHGEIKERGIQA